MNLQKLILLIVRVKRVHVKLIGSPRCKISCSVDVHPVHLLCKDGLISERQRALRS